MRCPAAFFSTAPVTTHEHDSHRHGGGGRSSHGCRWQYAAGPVAKFYVKKIVPCQIQTRLEMAKILLDDDDMIKMLTSEETDITSESGVENQIRSEFLFLHSMAMGLVLEMRQHPEFNFDLWISKLDSAAEDIRTVKIEALDSEISMREVELIFDSRPMIKTCTEMDRILTDIYCSVHNIKYMHDNALDTSIVPLPDDMRSPDEPRHVRGSPFEFSTLNVVKGRMKILAILKSLEVWQDLGFHQLAHIKLSEPYFESEVVPSKQQVCRAENSRSLAILVKTSLFTNPI